MPTYEAIVSWPDIVTGSIRFSAENEENAKEVLKENLPPIPGLEVQSMELVSADNIGSPNSKLN